ncbi:helix-turn-helix transcriptional regulator [Hyphococcus sp.]|uniref:helix-turn-helix transcriptional regulator n=1 Tax=Hyphococcus sp. TaxID=2038636 RepID=UPI0035C75740
MLSQMLLAMGLAAALNFLAIGAGLVFASGRAAPFRFVGAAGAFLTAAAMVMIWAGEVAMPFWRNLAEQAEFLLTLASGPVFFLIIASLAGAARRYGLIAAPAIAAGVILAGMSGGAPDIRGAVLVQIGYTAAAYVAVMRSARRPKTFYFAKAMVFALTAIHAAQLLRMAGPGNAMLAPIVPTATAIVASIFVSVMVARLVATRSSPKAASSATLEDLRTALVRENAYLDPDFKLADLARAAGLRSAEASALINQETGAGFVSFLNTERLRHAAALLAAPEEERTSIEAIALMSGFRSRSAFYRAFQAAFGQTPAAYRKSHV